MGFYGEIQAQDHDFKQVLRNTRTTIGDAQVMDDCLNENAKTNFPRELNECPNFSKNFRMHRKSTTNENKSGPRLNANQKKNECSF